MICRALDSNGDWTFGAGKGNYLSGNAAVTQTIQTDVSSWLGDCFFDLGAGVDWLNFLGGSKSQLALNLAVAANILNASDTTGAVYVTGVFQLSISLNTRTRGFAVTYLAQTIYSQSAQTNTFIYSSGLT